MSDTTRSSSGILGPGSTILITGATGLIGKALGTALLKEGARLICTTRDPAKAPGVAPFVAEWVKWDGSADPNTVEQLAADLSQLGGRIDAVIHLMGENIAEKRWTHEQKEKLIHSRVASTQALVQAVKAASKKTGALPQVWIQGSAVGIYGTAELAQPADEGTARGHGFLADLCAAWEGALESENLPAEVRRVVLRTGVVMSHRGGAFAKMAVPTLQGVGGVLGSGNQGMGLIHLDDVVRFIQYALKTPQVNGAFNLVCEEPTTQRILAENLCRKLNLSLGPPVPAVALKVLLGEMASILLDSLAVKSVRFSEVGFRLKYPSIDSILAEVTHWHLNPLEATEAVFCKYEEQFVPKPLAEVFPFFSDAHNLEKITPDFLNFKIQSISTPQIQAGTKIQYELKLHGIPLGWTTDICVWEPPVRFVDNQESGPYALWYHEHSFEEVPGGTVMRDWVRFKLPLGKIGGWFGYAKVKGDVDKIFEFRRKVIGSLL